MYCSLFSNLKNVLPEEKIKLLDEYFNSLQPNTEHYITPSVIRSTIQMNYETTVEVLLRLEDSGCLKRRYGIRCPECGLLIQTGDTIEDLDCDETECYGCGNNIELSEDNIVIFFKLTQNDNTDSTNGTNPFELGQQTYQEHQEPLTVNKSFVAHLQIQNEDKYQIFQAIEGPLKAMGENANAQIEDRIRRQQDEEIEGKYDTEAFKIQSRHKKINASISLLAYMFFVLFIYAVYKVKGYDKISPIISFGSPLIPFVVNYIVKVAFPENLDTIKRKLKSQELFVKQTAY